MPGVLAWGYYPTDKIWLPVQVDADGRIKADMSAINLDDLADVSVPAPGDDYFIYWDDATSLWKCRTLVDADIPATICRDSELATHAALPDVHHATHLKTLADHPLSIIPTMDDNHIPATIARDAEVATAVSDHAALTSGVHGVGALYIAKSTTDGLDMAAHAARHRNGGGDALSPLCLPDMVKQANYMIIPTASGWTEVLTGAGTTTQEPFRNTVRIPTTATGTALLYAPAYGFNTGGYYGRINWAKRLFLIFNYAIYKTEANLTRRVQLKQITTLGQLAELGVGFQVVNLAMTGESYGTERGIVSLGNMEVLVDPDYKQVQVTIEVTPGVSTNFYINGTLAGAITTAAQIPSGVSTDWCYLVHSLGRPSTGQALVVSSFLQGKIWQEM